jgi:hypothetical protein
MPRASPGPLHPGSGPCRAQEEPACASREHPVGVRHARGLETATDTFAEALRTREQAGARAGREDR